MKKSDLKIGMKVFHRNLKISGEVSSLKTGDNTSVFVEVDSGDELELSVHLLDKIEEE